ncbi:hypothetical protein KQX54_001049 [Cotesia glomerata]|uniref:Uncharacterized protein n=1 Tax=Cotesia glomerata TaxID=32391 RepID=A0AAV7IWH3_COTGL|nr:hypothetical protein KQX54_001049 [Cotesia glomerata]
MDIIKKRDYQLYCCLIIEEDQDYGKRKVVIDALVVPRWRYRFENTRRKGPKEKMAGEKKEKGIPDGRLVVPELRNVPCRPCGAKGDRQCLRVEWKPRGSCE